MMPNPVYTIAHAAINAVFQYHAEIAGRRKFAEQRGEMHYCKEDNTWCKNLNDFHITVYNNVVISPDTLSVELLQLFNLYELRDILTIYTINTPATWTYHYFTHNASDVCKWKQVRDFPSSVFNHATTLTTALDYVRDLINKRS